MSSRNSFPERTFVDWLFSACFIFVSGAIVMLTIGTIGCAIMTVVMISIIASDKSEQEIVNVD